MKHVRRTWRTCKETCRVTCHYPCLADDSWKLETAQYRTLSSEFDAPVILMLGSLNLYACRLQLNCTKSIHKHPQASRVCNFCQSRITGPGMDINHFFRLPSFRLAAVASRGLPFTSEVCIMP